MEEAICHGCGSVRYLEHGNCAPCNCGSSRISWVFTNAETCWEKINSDKLKFFMYEDTISIDSLEHVLDMIELSSKFNI